jgi:hypothetical protein
MGCCTTRTKAHREEPAGRGERQRTYASTDHQRVLEARGLVCSMSRRGNCHHNAVAESFFSTVKSELAVRFDSFGEAKMELFDYIDVLYNRQRRRHSTIGRISRPFERQFLRSGGVVNPSTEPDQAQPRATRETSTRRVQVPWQLFRAVGARKCSSTSSTLRSLM